MSDRSKTYKELLDQVDMMLKFCGSINLEPEKNPSWGDVKIMGEARDELSSALVGLGYPFYRIKLWSENKLAHSNEVV